MILRKQRHSGTSKRKNNIAVCGELDFEDIVDLSQDTLYRVSQEECARFREGVPYVKIYRYNPKHLCPKLNGYGDNGQRKVWSSCGSTHTVPVS